MPVGTRRRAKETVADTDPVGESGGRRDVTGGPTARSYTDDTSRTGVEGRAEERKRWGVVGIEGQW